MPRPERAHLDPRRQGAGVFATFSILDTGYLYLPYVGFLSFQCVGGHRSRRHDEIPHRRPLLPWRVYLLQQLFVRSLLDARLLVALTRVEFDSGAAHLVGVRFAAR